MLATLLMLFVSRRPAGVCGLLGRFSIIGITCLRCSSNSGSERHFGTYFSPLAFRVVAVQIGLQKSALAGSRLANCAY